jgi:O-antigen chain-terminating methyltransferase
VFFGRTLTPDEIAALKDEREAADRRYNEALTAVDRAIPALPEFPHPPLAYDETRLPELNRQWETAGEAAAGTTPHWKRWLSAPLWRLVRGHVAAETQAAMQRQAAFNSVLVDHLNRNVSVHRSTREALQTNASVLKAQLESLADFHARLVQYLQQVTPYVDTKDRGETLAGIVFGLSSGVSSGLTTVLDEFRRRAEAMVAREQRYVSAVDELRTSIAGVQQTGVMLKREVERLLAAPSAAGGVPGAVSAGAPAVPPSAAPMTDTVNAYKYVGFENKFRGSEDEIRARQLAYVEVFRGGSDVLDLGCGRGELLALLKEHAVPARGLDLNHEMVETCLARGLDAREGDAIVHLESLPDASLGGLIALQVVEHFAPAYLVRFLDIAFHKLRPGSRIVLETLNPSCWVAFFEAYIRDITHAWPLHPDTLKYLVVASGFQRVDVRMMSPYPEAAKLQHVSGASERSPLPLVGLESTFNENVNKLNALMFSYLDYAVIGERM